MFYKCNKKYSIPAGTNKKKKMQCPQNHSTWGWHVSREPAL